MSQPVDARSLALDLLHRLREAHLATCEGDQPRVRPLSVALVEGPTLYLASFHHWGKVSEIAANPRTEISYVDGGGRHLRLTGCATLREEPELKEKVYLAFPLIQRYFTGPADPRYSLIEFRAERVRVKDAWELEYREIAPSELR